MNIVPDLIALSIRLIILFVLVLAILVKPNKKRDTSYFKTKIYAHRGLHGGDVPENSIKAFEKARENGYGVELDVQMTKDGELVVFHDGSLSRMCGVDGFIKDFTYDELKQFKLAGSEYSIPLFKDVLDTLKDTDLICEIKGDNGTRCYDLCAKVYDALSTYEGKYCIESFAPLLVRWFKKHHPEVIRGQLSSDFSKDKSKNFFVRFFMTELCVNIVSKPDFIAYGMENTDTIGFKICRFLYRPFLVAWTAKGEAEIGEAFEIYDSVIFEELK